MLRVTGIQTNLHWENPEKNRQGFSKYFSALAGTTDLIILPELFTTGFSMNVSTTAEHMTGASVKWMQDWALKTQAAIVGSLPVLENGHYYNRLLFVHPSGKIDHYNKRHLFSLAKEQTVFTGGSERLIVNYKGWRICPLICYDLRFPVWSRNHQDYDLLLYTANWPKQRINAWDALLIARAIENISYVVGINRVGTDPKNNTYTGRSAGYDFLGNALTALPDNNEEVFTIALSKTKQDTTRHALGFLNDGD